MAESGLSFGATDLRAEIGEFMGIGRGVNVAWTADQLADINRVMDSGVRRVYYPTAVQGVQEGYEWSFLKPYTTLTTVVDQWEYDLPDDLGRILGQLHFPAEENRRSVPIVPVQQLLEHRARTATSGQPWFAAVRWKAGTAVTGQRQELLFWPTPDAEWIMPYQYEAYNGKLTDSLPYPLGGMKLAELYLESCLSVVEIRKNDEPGFHTQQYQLLLIGAVAADRRQGAEQFGQVGQPAIHTSLGFRRGYTGGDYPIEYKGNPV